MRFTILISIVLVSATDNIIKWPNRESRKDSKFGEEMSNVLRGGSNTDAWTEKDLIKNNAKDFNKNEIGDADDGDDSIKSMYEGRNVGVKSQHDILISEEISEASVKSYPLESSMKRNLMENLEKDNHVGIETMMLNKLEDEVFDERNMLGQLLCPKYGDHCYSSRPCCRGLACYGNSCKDPWHRIDGNMKQISVSRNHVWGVDSDSKVYHRNSVDKLWKLVHGALEQVSISGDGNHVWGVAPDNKLYYRNGVGGSWREIDGKLKQISVSWDGDHIWGVSPEDKVYYLNGLNAIWKPKSGSLKQVSVSGDGKHVWGVDSDNKIYYRDGVDGPWIPIDGKLMKQVTVNYDGSRVYAVNSIDEVFYRNGIGGYWKQIGVTTSMHQISVEPVGVLVWGVNFNKVYYMDAHREW